MKIWFLCFLFFADIPLPSLPLVFEVASPVVPDVIWPEKELSRKNVEPPTNMQMHLFQVELTLYGQTNRYSGLWKFSRDASFLVSNTQEKVVQIFTLSLYEIEQIELLSWRVGRISNSWYEFVPHQLRLISRNGKTNEGISDWSWLFRISLEINEKPWTAYTIFYDSWEKGAGNRLRWKHAQFPHFHYHFTTPLPGTVIRIRIFYP